MKDHILHYWINYGGGNGRVCSRSGHMQDSGQTVGRSVIRLFRRPWINSGQAYRQGAVGICSCSAAAISRLMVAAAALWAATSPS